MSKGNEEKAAGHQIWNGPADQHVGYGCNQRQAMKVKQNYGQGENLGGKGEFELTSYKFYNFYKNYNDYIFSFGVFVFFAAAKKHDP